METNPIFSNNIIKGQHFLNIAEDLGQILVVRHTLLVITEITPHLNNQSGWVGIRQVGSKPS